MLGKINVAYKFFFGTLLLVLCRSVATACECPLTSLGRAECDKYELIFKGKVLSVVTCDHKFGEALFEIQELYKGNSTKTFKVLFECNVTCASEFRAGEEWIIYTRYKQIGNAMMDWCSRSRKYFHNEPEDFYTVTYGNDYYEEAKFLKDSLGLHRFLKTELASVEGRNLIPEKGLTALLFICSLAFIILFYWLFNKFFKF